MKILHIITCVLGVVLCFNANSFADEKDEPKVEVKIPDTATALWAEIDEKSKSLAAVVATKDAKAVYVAAETVEALVRAIPQKYPNLTGDKKKRVEGQAKNTARVLDELHDAMNEGKADIAEKKLAQVEAALKIIKSQVAP